VFPVDVVGVVGVVVVPPVRRSPFMRQSTCCERIRGRNDRAPALAVFTEPDELDSPASFPWAAVAAVFVAGCAVGSTISGAGRAGM
jgi:hypothetical protein